MARSTGTIFLELQRTLLGWGNMHQIVEVEDNDAAQALIDQELAIKVNKSDVPTHPVGLMEQPPVRQANTAADEAAKNA